MYSYTNTTPELLITLCGPTVRATISPSRGAELLSLESLRAGSSWVELLHRAGDLAAPDGDAWQGRSPVLWPAVGRNFTASQLAASSERPAECRYTPNPALPDASLPVPLHGFAKDVAWKAGDVAVAADSVSATLVLESGDLSAELRAAYPFDFTAKITYSVNSTGLAVALSVVNTGSAAAMPWAAGTHPTFRVPFQRATFGDAAAEGAAWDAGFFDGSHTVDLALTSCSCLSGGAKTHAAPLSFGAFKDNVLGDAQRRTGAGATGTMSLHSPADGVTVRIDQSVAGAGLAGVELFFVMWGDRAAGFMCMEPWVGSPNSLNPEGRGAIVLGAGEEATWTHAYSVVHAL
jgi:galactose mutarotase-like enzyme